MTSESKSSMSIGLEYRDSRRLTSLFCAIGLGWSTAQFELKSLNFGPAGVVDASNASIPLILTCGIVYMTTKSIVGYAMQPEEVRRWHLAQIDFRIFLFLVRTTLLMLAAGGLHRSVDTFIFVAVGALTIVFGSFLAVLLGTMLLVPLILAIRKAIGRPYRGASPIPYISEASAWSELIVIVLLVALLVTLGFASLEYDPLLRLWTERPDPIAVTVFVVTAIAVVVSYWLQRLGERKLFAQPIPKLTKLPDGKIGVSFPSEKNTNGD